MTRMVRPVRRWQRLLLTSVGCSFLAVILFGVLALLVLRGSVDSGVKLGIMLLGDAILGLGWLTGWAGTRARSELVHERAHRSAR